MIIQVQQKLFKKCRCCGSLLRIENFHKSTSNGKNKTHTICKWCISLKRKNKVSLTPTLLKQKKVYKGEYQNIPLYPNQWKSLQNQFGENATILIQQLYSIRKWLGSKQTPLPLSLSFKGLYPQTANATYVILYELLTKYTKNDILLLPLIQNISSYYLTQSGIYDQIQEILFNNEIKVPVRIKELK